jgi:hypothetical protein
VTRVPWWGVLLIALGAGVVGAVAMVYYIGHGMFRNF